MTTFRRTWLAIAVAPLLGLGACGASQPTCPQDLYPVEYIATAPPEDPSGSSSHVLSAPTEVLIAGRLTKVDRVVSGLLCHDHWSGTVYVTCDVKVVEWEETPLFLKDCNFSVEPGSVVYVASHNDAPYYNGCSCHTGEEPGS